MPLIVHGGVIGMLTVDSTQPGCITSDDARLATAFPGQVAVALGNARRYNGAQERSELSENEERKVSDMNSIRKRPARVLGLVVAFLIVGLISGADYAGSLPTVAVCEIAWMGTTVSPSDEWIELYNNTDSENGSGVAGAHFDAKCNCASLTHVQRCDTVVTTR